MDNVISAQTILCASYRFMFGGKTPDFVLFPLGIPAGAGLSLYAGQSILLLLQDVFSDKASQVTVRISKLFTIF